MNVSTNNNILGTEKIGKLLLKFAIPAIIGQLVNMLYNVVDRIYIGNIKDVGGLAITGVGITSPLTLIITGFGMLIGIGAAASISLSLGRNESEKARKYLANALIGIFVISILIAVFGNIFATPIMRLFGATDTTLPYGLAYLRPLLVGTIFNLTAFGLNGCISSDGSPKIGMMTMIIGATINIILDPILIFVFDLGIQGAAYATVFSQFVAAMWLLFYFFKSKKSTIKLNLSLIRFDKSIMLGILSIGMAPFFMQLANSVVQVIANNSLLTYGGDLAIGAMAVITSICSIFIMPIFGLTHGSQPIIGFNYGAKQYDRVRKTYLAVVSLVTIILLVGYLGIMFIPSVLVGFFSRDPKLTQIAVDGMRIYLVCLPLIGIQMSASSFYQSIGQPKKSMLIGLTRQVIFLIPAFTLLPRFFGLNGVWYSGPIADILSVALSLFILIREFKKMRKLEMNAETAK